MERESLNNELIVIMFGIEKLRQELQTKVERGKGLLDPEVLETSEELDVLLNKFTIIKKAFVQPS